MADINGLFSGNGCRILLVFQESKVIQYLFLGAALGIFNGFISRYSLKKVILSSNRVFYSVWIIGLIYRLLFWICAALWLYFSGKNSIIIMLFSISLIFFQFIFEVFPVKHGNKPDS